MNAGQAGWRQIVNKEAPRGHISCLVKQKTLTLLWHDDFKGWILKI